MAADFKYRSLDSATGFCAVLKIKIQLYGDVQCCDPIGSDPSGCGDLFR